MTSKTLLIIGAGPNQIPAIRLAKKRGFRVAVTDMDPQAIGFEIADYHGVASTRDADKTIAVAKEFHQKHGIDGVMTMASESAVTVARVAEALGLPGVAPKAAWLASHKVDRQRAFHKHSVPSPKFCEAKSAEEAIEGAKEIGFPVVVKPPDSAGSRGVRKINNAEEMADAVSEIRTISKDQRFLVEQFLTGTEHSIEGLVIGGEVFWTGFSDRNYDKKEVYLPYFLEDGDTMPTSLSPEMLEKAREAAKQAVHALGINFGPAKGDILIDAEGPKMIEMAARLSGDYFCYETIPLHNGTQLVPAVMDQALGLEVDRDQLKPKFNKGVALRYLWPNPGRVTAIHGLEEARALSGVHFVRWEPKWKDLQVGSVIQKAKSMGERVGSVMAYADTQEEAIAIAEKAVRTIRITTE